MEQILIVELKNTQQLAKRMKKKKKEKEEWKIQIILEKYK